jgi:hypothetical protein
MALRALDSGKTPLPERACNNDADQPEIPFVRSFIQRRLGGSKYTADIHGTSRSALAVCTQFNPDPQSMIDR